MIPCINQATVLTTNTKTFLELSRLHNFTHVELDIGKMEEYIAKDGKAALKNSLVDNKITVVSLNAIENYPILTEDETKKSLRRCREIIELSNSLNCKIVVVNPNEVTATERVLMQRKFDEFMIETAKIAEAYDIRLGFEYVSDDNRIINTLTQSLNRLSEWDHGIGLVLDIFHMYRSGEMLGRLPEKIWPLLWAVHVNDAPNMPIPDLRDSDRVMPLEGVVNLRDYTSQLHTMKFDGPISVELFNKKYWEMDPEQVIEKARSSLKELGV